MPENRRVAEDLVSYLAGPENFVLPQPVEVDDAAEQIFALYEESGREGATFSLYFGDMSGKPLYSVSIWPERARKVNGGSVKLRILQALIIENLDLLDDPRASVGLWYNADENVTYLDVAAVLPNRQEAVTLAAQYD